jgi:hypothetical protein
MFGLPPLRSSTGTGSRVALEISEISRSRVCLPPGRLCEWALKSLAELEAHGLKASTVCRSDFAEQEALIDEGNCPAPLLTQKCPG